MSQDLWVTGTLHLRAAQLLSGGSSLQFHQQNPVLCGWPIWNYPLAALRPKRTDISILSLSRIEPLGHIGGPACHVIQGARRFAATEEENYERILAVGGEERSGHIGEGAPCLVIEPRNQLPPLETRVEVLKVRELICRLQIGPVAPPEVMAGHFIGCSKITRLVWL